MSQRSLKIGVLVGFAVAFLFVVFLLALVFVFFVIPGGIVEEEKEIIDYQLLIHDPSTDYTSFGIISLFDEIEEDDFISYENNLGHHVLISNFGSTEYRCTGVCYCDEGRRRTASLLRQPMLYFVTAVSAVSALSLAKSFFHGVCRWELDENCVPDSLKVDEEKCAEEILKEQGPEEDFDYSKSDVTGDDLFYLDEEVDTTEFFEKLKESELTTHRYQCKGNCVLTGPLKYHYETLETDAWHIYKMDLSGTIWDLLWEKHEMCRKMEMEGEVKLSISSAYHFAHVNYLAAEEFELKYLRGYCDKTTKLEEVEVELVKKHVEEELINEMPEKEFSWCYSRELQSVGPNIKCRKIE